MSTIVFHDAQTLPEWHVEEAAPPDLHVIALPNAGERRSWEYVGDGLDAHVDRVVAAAAGAAEPVGVGGSSFGAYASLYTWALHPTLFTRVLAMSPALWVRRERVFEAVEAAEPVPGTRVWIDVGGRESETHQAEYEAGYAEMHALLEAKGCALGGFRDPEAPHHESAWAKRLPEALRFLYAPAP